MKTKTETIPETAVLDTWVEGAPFQITGDYEAVADQLPNADRYVASLAMPAVTHVEGPKTAPKAEPEYLSLADLDDRTIARMSLEAFKYDIVTFGRNRQYKRFKETVQAERDLAMDMKLGIIQRVHCRLHEKALAQKQGL